MVSTEVTGGGTNLGWSASAGSWRELREATGLPPPTNSRSKLNWAQSLTGTLRVMESFKKGGVNFTGLTVMVRPPLGRVMVWANWGAG